MKKIIWKIKVNPETKDNILETCKKNDYQVDEFLDTILTFYDRSILKLNEIKPKKKT